MLHMAHKDVKMDFNILIEIEGEKKLSFSTVYFNMDMLLGVNTKPYLKYNLRK